LAVLAPELERRGLRPSIVVGTSVGALNAAFLAANAQRPIGELIPAALSIWRSVHWGEVARDIVSGESLVRVGEYAGGVLGVPGAQLDSLLDPAPLAKTLRDRIDFGQIRRNVEDGTLDAAAVVSLSAFSGRSVVFHDGGPTPAADVQRGIDYVATALADEHVLASAAIPAVFPAVHVEQPRVARGWYFDGGTRLNTPIKPALELGASRVVVIALGSLAAGPAKIANDQRADALDGAGQLLQAVLGDQLTQDVQTLARRNQFAAQTRDRVPGLRQVPFILIAPRRRDTIAKLALRVFREHYSGPWQSLRSPNIALLGRLIGGGDNAQHADLLSFLLFAPEFAQALIDLGRRDARRWLKASHEFEELWQLVPSS
jgi:NTE family protein